MSIFTDPLLPEVSAVDDARPHTTEFIKQLLRRLYELFVKTTQRLSALETVMGTTAGAQTQNMQISPATNDVRLGPAGAVTGMTTGFVFIPAVAGAPTGAPTAQTGFVPIIFDSTNLQIYIYTGGAWKKTVALT